MLRNATLALNTLLILAIAHFSSVNLLARYLYTVFLSIFAFILGALGFAAVPLNPQYLAAL